DCDERLFRRSACPDRAGRFQTWRTSFFSAVLARQSRLRPGVSGGQRPFPPVRTSACGLVCLRRDLLPGPRSCLLPADRFSRLQEAESAGCLIEHIPILYMELTQIWQNPPFRFATMKKSRSAACKCFRPETHSETEGTIHGRKQRPHPSVPDPVR